MLRSYLTYEGYTHSCQEVSTSAIVDALEEFANDPRRG